MLKHARQRDLLSDEHFTVDGTLLEAWVGQKSFRRVDDDYQSPAVRNDVGSNPTVNLHGEQRSKHTHCSTADPDDAVLARKSGGIRKVVSWELARTPVARLPIAALEKAIAERKPHPRLVHHSDRGVQYASDDYVRILTKHRAIPSMSRPANPYDDASCESFLKTLKREEICASLYEDLDHVRVNIGIVFEYYDRQRLHSALARERPQRSR